jgi:hypothetical protein
MTPTFAGPGEAARVAIESEQRMRLLESELRALAEKRDTAHKAYMAYMSRTAPPVDADADRDSGDTEAERAA